MVGLFLLSAIVCVKDLDKLNLAMVFGFRLEPISCYERVAHIESGPKGTTNNHLCYFYQGSVYMPDTLSNSIKCDKLSWFLFFPVNFVHLFLLNY